MNNQLTEIHIALAFDENFITPFYVLLTSIFDSNKKNNITFHVIATGVDEEKKKNIIQYVESNRKKIIFYDINKFIQIDGLNNSHLKTTRFTIAVFYRLFFPFLVPENLKRILYIDVDTIVLDGLESLYFADISPFPIGAAKDNTMGIENDDVLLKKIGVSNDNLFNSGVLLIDIDLWKKQKVFERAMEFVKENQNILKYFDQDALNYALKNNWYKLSNQYNFCHSEIPVELTKNEILKNNKITILHYTSSKPWHFTNSARLRSIYYNYFKKTPYAYKKKYKDFTWTKFSFRGFIYIRILEFYLDHPWIRNFWKKFKS